MCLNPFENQVYFHVVVDKTLKELLGSLNPFENQVYFHCFKFSKMENQQIAMS